MVVMYAPTSYPFPKKNSFLKTQVILEDKAILKQKVGMKVSQYLCQIPFTL